MQLFFPGQTQRTYQGIAQTDLKRIEAMYDITIRVLSLIPNKEKSKGVSSQMKNLKKGVSCTLKCTRGNLMEVEEGKKVMTLNLYNYPFSLVTDLEKYTQFHMCTKCQGLFQLEYNQRRHTNIKKDCTKVSFIYQRGVYRNKPSVFSKTERVGNRNPSRPRHIPLQNSLQF